MPGLVKNASVASISQIMSMHSSGYAGLPKDMSSQSTANCLMSLFASLPVAPNKASFVFFISKLFCSLRAAPTPPKAAAQMFGGCWQGPCWA